MFVVEGWDFLGGQGRDSEWGGSSCSWRFLFVGCLVSSETAFKIIIYMLIPTIFHDMYAI